MVYNGKPVLDRDTFDYSEAKLGTLVDADVVMDAMNALPPACMRSTCAQVGEPYSHETDPETGRWRATYATFRCVQGDFQNGVWEFCGYCFRGETINRKEGLADG